jgi:hypothetical protein
MRHCQVDPDRQPLTVSFPNPRPRAHHRRDSDRAPRRQPPAKRIQQPFLVMLPEALVGAHCTRCRAAFACRLRALPLLPLRRDARAEQRADKPVRTAVCHALLPRVRVRVHQRRPPLCPTPRAVASEQRELHARTGALAAPSRCRVVSSARESRLAPLGHQRPDNACTHASAPRLLCRVHCRRVASFAQHLTTSPSWTGVRDKMRSSASPSRWHLMLAPSPAPAPL